MTPEIFARHVGNMTSFRKAHADMEKKNGARLSTGRMLVDMPVLRFDPDQALFGDRYTPALLCLSSETLSANRVLQYKLSVN